MEQGTLPGAQHHILCRNANTQSGVETLIGHTPLVRIRRASAATGCEILAKAEFLNPSGSIKDRTALALLRDAERRNVIHPGGLVVEGSTGNTGIGLALIGASCGYRTAIVMPTSQSRDKVRILQQLGAHLTLVPEVPYSNAEHYIRISERLANDAREREPCGAFWANQFDNIANRQIHFETTGAEIWEQTQGHIDAFVCAVGTGGTLAGTSAALKAHKPEVLTALAHPEHTAAEGGALLSEGIGTSRITGNLEGIEIDAAFRIPDSEWLPLLYELLQHEGLCVGSSSAVNLAAAIRLAREIGPGHVIVTIFADSGLRYQSTLFNSEFLRSHGHQATGPSLSDSCRYGVAGRDGARTNSSLHGWIHAS